ncbi:hypothetical protein SNEBB_004573 [Seison nebaliae]|nr:hypothetical protein SNEBB_004573 [Seison nebaliae]
MRVGRSKTAIDISNVKENIKSTNRLRTGKLKGNEQLGPKLPHIRITQDDMSTSMCFKEFFEHFKYCGNYNQYWDLLKAKNDFGINELFIEDFILSQTINDKRSIYKLWENGEIKDFNPNNFDLLEREENELNLSLVDEMFESEKTEATEDIGENENVVKDKEENPFDDRNFNHFALSLKWNSMKVTERIYFINDCRKFQRKLNRRKKNIRRTYLNRWKSDLEVIEKEIEEKELELEEKKEYFNEISDEYSVRIDESIKKRNYVKQKCLDEADKRLQLIREDRDLKRQERKKIHEVKLKNFRSLYKEKLKKFSQLKNDAENDDEIFKIREDEQKYYVEHEKNIQEECFDYDEKEEEIDKEEENEDNQIYAKDNREEEELMEKEDEECKKIKEEATRQVKFFGNLLLTLQNDLIQLKERQSDLSGKINEMEELQEKESEEIIKLQMTIDEKVENSKNELKEIINSKYTKLIRVREKNMSRRRDLFSLIHTQAKTRPFNYTYNITWPMRR